MVGNPEVDVLWHTWRAMIRRCHDPRRKSFKNYGARGYPRVRAMAGVPDRLSGV